MKKLILFFAPLLLTTLFFTNCKKIAVDKNGKNIYDKLIVAFDNYDKPLIDSILNSDIDLSEKSYIWHFDNFLQKTVAQNDILRFKMLLDKGINTAESQYASGSDCIISNILYNEKLDYFNLWMKSKNKITNQEFELDKPLYWAILHNNFDAVKTLIGKGANTNYEFYTTDKIYNSCLLAAIINMNPTIFEYLIANKANIQQTFTLWKNTGYENQKVTLLHFLALKSSFIHDNDSENREKIQKIADILLSKGLNINGLTSNNHKAIDFIGFDINHNTNSYNYWFLEYLIQRGTTVKTQDYSTFNNAIQNQDFGKISFLIQKGYARWDEIDLNDIDFYEQKYVSAVSGIKLRAQPNTQSQAIASIAYQEELTISNLYVKQETIENIQGHWVYVAYKGFKGFVFDGFLN